MYQRNLLCQTKIAIDSSNHFGTEAPCASRSLSPDFLKSGTDVLAHMEAE